MSRSYRKNPCSSPARRSNKGGKRIANQCLRAVVKRMMQKMQGENQYIYFDYSHPPRNEVFDYGWCVEPGSYCDPKDLKFVSSQNYRKFYGK
jgi:hypothetical protein